MKFFKILLWIVAGTSVVIGGFFLWNKLQILSIKSDVRKSFIDYELDQNNLSGEIDPSVLQPLEGKNIIGFGEATHGTKEFRAAFTQLAKYLIASGRINILVYAERNFADSWLVNEFLQGEEASVSVDRIFPYSSKEEKELIEWIKTFNKSKLDDEKIWVAGADMYHPKYAATNAIYLLNKYQSNVSAATMQVLNDWACSPISFNFFLGGAENIKIEQELSTIYKELTGIKDANMRSLRDKWLTQSIKLISEGIKHARAKSSESGIRDSIMFDNINWLLSAKKNAKLLIFAHNSHIEKFPSNTLSANNARLGWLINKRFPSSYYTIACEVEKGLYRSGQDKTSKIPQSFMKIGSIIGESVDQESGYLNLHQSKDIENFLNKEWYITYGVLDTENPTYPKAKDFSKAFDMVFWARNSTPLEISKPDSYNIVTSFNRKEDPNVFSNKISLHLNTEFDLFPLQSDLYDYPDLGILFYSKNKLVDYHLQKIYKSGILDLNKDVKPNIDSAIVYIAGNRNRTFSLTKFSINNSVISKDKILYSGPNYNKLDVPDRPIYLQLDNQ